MLRSIRWTLQLWHAAILGTALACFGTALYLVVSRAQLGRVDAELEKTARELAHWPPPMPGGRGGPGGFGGQGGFGRASSFDSDPAAHRPPPAPGEGGTPRKGPRWEKGRLPRRGMDEPNGPAGPMPPGRRGYSGVVFMSSPKEWWAGVPRDTLQRVGQDEQDQPYFIVWGMWGEVLQASSAGLDVPPPWGEGRKAGPPKGPDASPPSGPIIFSPANVHSSFRQRGLLREAILEGPFGVTVLVGRSLRAEEASLRQLRWILLGAGAGVMAIGLCGGWLLSKRVTRPIRVISETARAISASDLSRRIDVKEADSELGSLAQTLNETFERLETAFQRQVRFTADASHELRTPLSIIHSHAELALTRDRTAPEYKQAMETCLRAAKRTKSLVDALLVLARADAGKLDLKYERFDLQGAADEALAMVQARAQERSVSIETHVQPVELEADRTRVLQLLTNLLVNAIQYNRPGGRVVLTLAQEAPSEKRGHSPFPAAPPVLPAGQRKEKGECPLFRGEAVLTVADTGVGIAAEDQPHLFERFFRADKARSREAGGSGLGLAICQSIVEAHHGSITFTSQPGCGTTFVVRLPVAPA